MIRLGIPIKIKTYIFQNENSCFVLLQLIHFAKVKRNCINDAEPIMEFATPRLSIRPEFHRTIDFLVCFL